MWPIVAAWFQESRSRTTRGAKSQSIHCLTQRRMRRILILLVILAVVAAALAALWIFKGREIASFIDPYWTVETLSAPVQSISYEGSGSGGVLIVNGVSLSLNKVKPGLSVSVGLTK